VTALQGELFDCRPPRPRKAPKEDNPAYLPSRESAEQGRDRHLAKFRAHQQQCQRCLAAATPPPGRRPHEELCGEGLVDVMQAARLQRGILTGRYPDRRETVAQTRSGGSDQGALFGPDGEEP
jgi:hypothetical protein